MEFARPHLFWLFLIYIPLIFWYVYKIRKIDPTIQASTLDAVKNFRTSYRVWLRHGLFAVRLLAIGCLIVILCRPQTSNKWETSSVEGTDIVIALLAAAEPDRQESTVPQREHGGGMTFGKGSGGKNLFFQHGCQNPYGVSSHSLLRWRKPRLRLCCTGVTGVRDTISTLPWRNARFHSDQAAIGQRPIISKRQSCARSCVPQRW